jgi:hypothetical protein
VTKRRNPRLARCHPNQEKPWYVLGREAREPAPAPAPATPAPAEAPPAPPGPATPAGWVVHKVWPGGRRLLLWATATHARAVQLAATLPAAALAGGARLTVGPAPAPAA